MQDQDIRFHLHQVQRDCTRVGHAATCDDCGWTTTKDSTNKAMLAICGHMLQAHGWDMLS